MRRVAVRGGASRCALVLLAATTGQVSAQEGPLRPLSEYLELAGGELAEAPVLVTRRCAALYSLVADQRRRRGDGGTAEMYTAWGIGFQARASATALDAGTPTDEALRLNQDAIEKITERLAARMRRIPSLADDPVLSSDVRTCRGLVDALEL